MPSPSTPTIAPLADALPIASAALPAVHKALFMAVQAVLAATFLALCPPAPVPSVSQEPASGRIGLGVAAMPTHAGSPNRRTLAGPDLPLSQCSRDRGTVGSGQRGRIWNAVEPGRFSFVLVAQVGPGRQDRDTSTRDPSPGGKRLAGMGNVRASTGAGVGTGHGPVVLVAHAF